MSKEISVQLYIGEGADQRHSYPGIASTASFFLNGTEPVSADARCVTTGWTG